MITYDLFIVVFLAPRGIFSRKKTLLAHGILHGRSLEDLLNPLFPLYGSNVCSTCTPALEVVSRLHPRFIPEAPSRNTSGVSPHDTALSQVRPEPPMNSETCQICDRKPASPDRFQQSTSAGGGQLVARFDFFLTHPRAGTAPRINAASP